MMLHPWRARMRPLEVVGDCGRQDRHEVTFLPSPKPSRNIEFDFDTLEHRLRELAFLNSGCHITWPTSAASDAEAVDLL
jgi:DNA gyrase subunit B